MSGQAPSGGQNTLDEQVHRARQTAKHKLSAKRFVHVQGVVAAAKQLAKRYGASVQKAELAAWLHDIVKEDSKDDLLRTLSQDAIMAGSTTRRPFAVWHGPAAAVYAKQCLGVCDEEVLRAVANHTTGRAGMGKLEKILYLADMISEERDFAGIEEIRAAAKRSLDEGVLAAMRYSMAHVYGKGGEVDEQSALALQWMEQQL